MNIENIKKWLVKKFPEDVRMEGEQLYIHYVPVKVEKNWFRGIQITTEHFSIKGRKFHNIEQSICDIVKAETLQIKLLQVIRTFDPNSFNIKISPGPDFLYVFDQRMNFKMICEVLGDNTFRLIFLLFHSDKDGIEVIGTYEEVMEKGTDVLTRSLKKIRLERLMKDPKEIDVENMLLPFFPYVGGYLNVQLEILEKGAPEKIRKQFVAHFKEKYHPYFPYIDPTDKRKQTEVKYNVLESVRKQMKKENVGK